MPAPILFKADDGSVQEVLESKTLTLDDIDQRIAEAQAHVQHLQDLRVQVDALQNGTDTVTPPADAPAAPEAPVVPDVPAAPADGTVADPATPAADAPAAGGVDITVTPGDAAPAAPADAPVAPAADVPAAPVVPEQPIVGA